MFSKHHAYAIEGGTEARHKFFKILENSWKISARDNPEFLHQKFEILGVEEARTIKAWQEKKSFASGGKKVFVIEAETITPEAQNSLLKMFEEPSPDTYFFLIGNCVKYLIPTLVSRIARIDMRE